MQILITEVTEMQHGNFCVGGWDPVGQRMIRPLPGGRNWTAPLLTQHGVAPGVTLEIVPRGVSTGAFPHRTEDLPIDSATIARIGSGFSDWLDAGAPPFAPNLSVGFADAVEWNSVWNQIRQGVYVAAGTQCKSLIAVQVARSQLSFTEAFGKLKAIIHDGSARYQLAVSSRVLKENWRSKGVGAIQGKLPNRGTFCVRLGLARPFGNPPDKCYIMVNSVL